MIFFTKKTTLVFLLLGIFASGCVSKKKHLEALQTLRGKNEKVVMDWQKKFNHERKELNKAKAEIESLHLLLAERKGENNILVGLRTELQSQIDDLEKQLKSAGTSSETQQQNLSSEIQKKEQRISFLRSQLKSVNDVLEKNKKLLEGVAADLSQALAPLGNDEIEVTTMFDQVVVTIPEKLLFRPKSASRLTDFGKRVLQNVSQVINRNPNVLMQAMGHTDTTPADANRYKDNWNFSALQAATVARTFVIDFEVSTSQLSLAAKGEFEPRASNSTSEGKAQNRRMEILIYRPNEDLAKEVKRVIEGK